MGVFFFNAFNQSAFFFANGYGVPTPPTGNAQQGIQFIFGRFGGMWSR